MKKESLAKSLGLMNSKEAARFISVKNLCPDDVVEAARRGRLQGHFIRGSRNRWFFSKKQLNAFQEDLCANPNS